MDIIRLGKVVNLIAGGLSIIYSSICLGRMAGRAVDKKQKRSETIKAGS